MCRFAAAQSGNVALLFALLAFPLIGFIGFAVDYSRALSVKSTLQATADAAVLAALAPRSQILGAGASAQDAASKAAAERYFASSALPAGTVLNSAVATVTRVNGQVQASIAYSVTIDTTLARVLGAATINMSGVSAAATGAASPRYIDIYVLADASASMGIGATPADQTIMFNTAGMDGGSNGCTVACHAIGTDALARGHGAVLRFDVVRNAIASMVSQAQTANAGGGNIRVGLYTFGNALKTEIDITTSLNLVATATTNMQLAGFEAGTNTAYALTSLKAKIATPYGDGTTAANPLVFVMFMTDATGNSADNHSATNWTVSPNFVSYSPHSIPDPVGNGVMDLEGLNPAWCQPLKTAGANVMTLETQYVIPPNNLFNSWEEHSRYDYIKNTLKPNLTQNMKDCATAPTYAFSADQPADIQAAVQKMFAAAINTNPRLTQ